MTESQVKRTHREIEKHMSDISVLNRVRMYIPSGHTVLDMAKGTLCFVLQRDGVKEEIQLSVDDVDTLIAMKRARIGSLEKSLSKNF